MSRALSLFCQAIWLDHSAEQFLIFATNVLMYLSATPFWWWAPTPQNVILWTLSFKSTLNSSDLKMPLVSSESLKVYSTWLCIYFNLVFLNNSFCCTSALLESNIQYVICCWQIKMTIESSWYYFIYLLCVKGLPGLVDSAWLIWIKSLVSLMEAVSVILRFPFAFLWALLIWQAAQTTCSAKDIQFVKKPCFVKSLTYTIFMWSNVI